MRHQDLNIMNQILYNEWSLLHTSSITAAQDCISLFFFFFGSCVITLDHILFAVNENSYVFTQKLMLSQIYSSLHLCSWCFETM